MTMGKWLMIIGVLVLLVGGDLRFGSGNSRVFIPITSMILVSIILTIIVNLFRH